MSARSRPASHAWWERWTHSEHARGLLLIGLFKLSKAVLSVALGVGALKLMHHDIGNVVLRVSDALRIDPENHLVWLLTYKADLIGSHELRRFSILTFAYAVVCLVEGTGLVLEKRWAEYFTLFLTLLGLPWEGYELARHTTMLRVGLLVINLAVLAYLVWLLRRRRRVRLRLSE
ncbi:MAG TPA: DUF2127 domain-containing protein [Acidobacteriaceae bacterium]|nr:DUF2127 domain-containing protein [Acidobacteriaceae bacterium]